MADDQKDETPDEQKVETPDEQKDEKKQESAAPTTEEAPAETQSETAAPEPETPPEAVPEPEKVPDPPEPAPEELASDDMAVDEAGEEPLDSDEDGLEPSPTSGARQSGEVDLEAMDDDYANAPDPEPSGDFEPIPDGRYQVQIHDIKVARSQNTDAPMVKWELTILGEGKYAGRHLFRNNMLETEQNKTWLKKDLGVCGIDLGGKISTLPNRIGEMIGMRLEVQVKKAGEFYNVFLNKYLGHSESAGAGFGTGDAAGDALDDELKRQADKVF